MPIPRLDANSALGVLFSIVRLRVARLATGFYGSSATVMLSERGQPAKEGDRLGSDLSRNS